MTTAMPGSVVVGGQAPGLAVVRSLNRRGIAVALASYNSSDPARRSRHVREVIDVPEPMMDEPGFIARLRSMPTAWHGSVLMASGDQSALALARCRDKLSDRFWVVSPSWSAVERFVDKKFTYRLAQDVGVPVPNTVAPSDRTEAERALAAFSFPVLIKPSQGHLFQHAFGTKMFEAGDPVAAMEAYDHCTDLGIDVMIQEIIAGPPELGVNHIALAVKGQVVAQFTARKIRNWPAEYGSPSAVRSELVTDVIGPTGALLRATEYDGFACAEYKFDPRDRRYKLMEVNVRHNLSGALAPRCGVDFPWLQYKIAAGYPVEPASGFQERIYWVDSLRDLRHLAHDPKGNARKLTTFVRPYLRRRVEARWAWADPGPFVDSVGCLALRLLSDFSRRFTSAITGDLHPRHGSRDRKVSGRFTGERRPPKSRPRDGKAGSI